MLKRLVKYGVICGITGVILWQMGVKDFFTLPETAPANATQPVSTVNATQTDSASSGITATTNASLTNSTSSAALTDENALSLALEAIDLVQGEGGFDLWRLKAEWANIRQEDGIIIVEKPNLRYFLKNAEELTVSSVRGEIDQAKQILIFIGSVIANHNDYSITGKELVYNGAQKSMTFPQGGNIVGSGVAGQANLIQWLMESRTIHADGDVDVTFQKSPQFGKKPEVGNATLPNAQQ